MPHQVVLVAGASGQGTPPFIPSPLLMSTSPQDKLYLCSQGCSWCMPAVLCIPRTALSAKDAARGPTPIIPAAPTSQAPPSCPPHPSNIPAPDIAAHLGRSLAHPSASASQGWAHTLVCTGAPDGACCVWGRGWDAHGQLGQLPHAAMDTESIQRPERHAACKEAAPHVLLGGAGQPHDQKDAHADLGAWKPIHLPAAQWPIKMVAAGHSHSLFLDASGGVWSLGGNKHGQLGVGHAGGDCHSPQRVMGDHRVKQVACGALHSLAVTVDGTLMSWGWAGVGALGHGSIMDAVTPRAVRALLGLRIAQAAGGGGHSLALSADGDVYSFGSNTHGQLGLGNISSMSTTPQLVEAITDTITQVSAGCRHSLALSEDGRPLTWGFNGFGQLGVGDMQDRHAPCAMVLGVGGTQGHHAPCAATPVRDPEQQQACARCQTLSPGAPPGMHAGPQPLLSRRRVLQVAAGWWHSLLLLEEKERDCAA